MANRKFRYRDAVKRLMGLPDFERSKHLPGHSSFHLARMSLILDQLGNPHTEIRTIHIAGTNGKGSTSTMVTSILTAAGYRVGLYTSPHLHRVTERIRVGLKPITPSDFSNLVERVWPHVEIVGEQGGYGPLTFFEVLTAMAFEYFREKEVDFQVVEVGLGGSLDATNLVNPDVCVITSISLDHVSTLGDTIGQIAFAKAGIIKDGVPVVVAPQNGEVMKVIGEVASLRSAPLSQVGEEFSWECLQSDETGQHIEIHGSQETYRAHLPLLGDYQIENAAAAIGAIEILSDRGAIISGDSITQGLSSVVWPARLQKITCTRSALVDGAHNPDSMRRLMDAIQDNFKFRHLYVVFGTGVGHLVEKMFAELCRFSPLVIAVQSRDPRAASAERIACMSRDVGLKVMGEYANVADGVQKGVSLAGDGDIILGTGSLFVAAEMIEELEGIQPEIYLGLEKRSSRMGGSI